MIITRECDYAFRIVRALSSGEKLSVNEICEREHISSQFAYKILRKLDKAKIVKSFRGTAGGYLLSADLSILTLYDIIIAIDKNFNITECMRSDSICTRNTDSSPCIIHHELCSIQNKLISQLRSKSLKQILNK